MVKDFLGKKFENVEEMCKYWFISPKTYRNRLKNGWTKEDSLTRLKKGKSIPRKLCRDYKGNWYRSIERMIEAYGLEESTFLERVNLNWTLRRTLDTPKGAEQGASILEEKLRRKEKLKELGLGEFLLVDGKVTDHLGNTYIDLSDMCKEWRITTSEFHIKKKRGYSLKEILTKEEDKVIDHLWNTYDSIEAMCEKWGISKDDFYKLERRGKELRELLEGNSKKQKKTENTKRKANLYKN